MRFILTLIISLLACLVQAGNVTFIVKDKSSNEPIKQCKVWIQNAVSLTDSNGKVVVTYPNSNFQVRFSALNYEELTKDYYHLKIDKTTITVYLIPSSTDLKTLVVTAQVKPMLASQSVYKVNTISSQQIYQRGATTLNEVLNFENNNYISNDNLLGASVSIGGISGQNVKILVNGIAMSGRENGNIDLGQINMQQVKRIEMIQGPMSVIYGSNAMGGVINLITKTPEKPLSLGFKTYLESIGRYNFSGTAGYLKNKHQFQLSLARNFFQGWNATDSLDRFMLWKPKTQYLVDLYYHYKLSKKVSLGYYGNFLNEKITNKGIPIISPYEGYAFDEYYRTTRSMNTLSATIQIDTNSSLALANSYTYYQRNKNRYKKDLVTLNQIPTTSTGDQDSSYFNTINLRGIYTNSHIKHTDLSFGYEYNLETATSSKLSTDLKPISDLGLFLSGTYTAKKWSIQPSARYTINNLFGKALTPALHVRLSCTDQIQYRASVATGFRTPSQKELYLQFVDQNHTILGNKDLKPETGVRFEHSLQWNTTVSKVKSTIGLSFAYNDLHNMITLALVNGHQVLREYRNIEQYRNFISGLSVVNQWNNLSVRQGVSYTYVQQGIYIPQHQIVEYSFLGSYYWHRVKTRLNVNYKYSSTQPLISTDNQVLFTDAIHVATMSVQRTFFNQSLQVQLGVKNIFNIQNSGVNGATDLQGNPHVSTQGLNLFPGRSIFIDLNYNL